MCRGRLDLSQKRRLRSQFDDTAFQSVGQIRHVARQAKTHCLPAQFGYRGPPPDLGTITEMTNPTGHDISGEGNELYQEAFRDFGRYLVGLSWLDMQPQQPRAFFVSGFVMEFGGNWYWVTAGHIVEEIEIVLSRGKAESFRLIDTYGNAVDHNPIPFDFPSAWKTSCYDKKEGLDFAAVRLGPLERQALERNGVRPVTEAEWRAADHLGYGEYIMLGLPTDCVKVKANADTVFGRADPSLIHAAQLSPVPPHFITPSPRLIASINSHWPDGDIDGMSGGPVFGMDMATGKTEVVAVQSHWRVDERIIAACPVSVFAPLVAQAILTRTR
jgi:hypothetical protein